MDLTPDDIQAIARLTSLIALRFDGCGVRAELDPLGNLTNVTELHLIKNYRSRHAVHELHDKARKDLRFTTIHEGIKYLADLPALKVWLTGTGIDDGTVILCSKLKRLEALIPETQVTADGVMQLYKCTGYRSLLHLVVYPGSNDRSLLRLWRSCRSTSAGKDVPSHDNPYRMAFLRCVSCMHLPGPARELF